MGKAVPEGWKKVRLKNVSTHINEKIKSNMIPYIEIGDVVPGSWVYQVKDKLATGTAIKARKGDICISTVRPTRRAMIMLKEDAAVSPAFTVLRSKGNSDWCFVFEAIKYQQFYDRLGVLATGSTYPTCSHSDVLFYEFLLPPFPEQQKISAILSSVDDAIEKTKAVIEQTKFVKKGLMQELFIKGIPGRHKKFKKTPIGEIPEKWSVINLGKLGYLYSGFTINQNRVVKSNPRPYLRVANVQQGYFALEDIKFLEASDEEFFSKQIQKNDILIIEGHANLNALGRCAVATDNVVGMTHQNHIHRFSPILSLCNSHYIAFALSIKQIRRLIELEGGTTSGLHTLSKNSIASIPIALPSLNEQSTISNMILSLQRVINDNNNCLNELGVLKVALMQVLLSGEVRVKV